MVMVDNDLRLSLVIPVYNEQYLILKCLEAIAAQTVQPDEVIVVNNNSTDDSVKIAKTFPFVKVITEKKQGIVHARNAGFNAATGNIIGRIDADTVLPPGWVHYVKRFYSDVDNSNTALSGGGFFYNIRLPRFNGWIQGQVAFRMNRFIIGHYILWGSNMAFPLSWWQKVANQTCSRDDIHEDLDLAIHLHRAGCNIAYREHLRVGVKLKRVWENRWDQRKHLARWPRTLKVHGYKLWWLGSVGNVFIVVAGEPFIFVSEALARIAGRPRA